jgi:hypothetical protein
MRTEDRRDHKLAIEETIGVAAATTVTWTVPAGCTARIVGAWGYHNHADASDTQWFVSDTTTTKEISSRVSTAPTTGRHALYGGPNFAENLILHAGWQLKFYTKDIAGGESSYMTTLVELRKGEPSDG